MGRPVVETPTTLGILPCARTTTNLQSFFFPSANSAPGLRASACHLRIHAAGQNTGVGSVLRQVPVGSRITAWPAEVQPRLTVGAGSMVRETSVSRSSHVRRFPTGTPSRVSRVHVSGRGVAVLHEGAATAVDVRKGVDVLQLGTTNVATRRVVITTTAATATSVTVAAIVVVTVVRLEGRIFSGKLGLDSFAVRSVADGREDGTDALHKNHTLSNLTVVKDGLDHIVAVAVTKQLFQSRSVEHFTDEYLADFGIGHTYTLFDNIGGESTSC